MYQIVRFKKVSGRCKKNLKIVENDGVEEMVLMDRDK